MSAVKILQLSDVPILLDQLRQERFYGRVSFDLREGEVTLIRTERTQLVNTSKTHQGANHDVSSTHSDTR